MKMDKLKLKLQDLLQYSANEFLLPASYCQKQKWKLLYFDELFFEEYKIDFMIKKLKEFTEAIKVFIFTKSDIETFIAETAELKILKSGLYYYDSVNTANSEDMKEVFSFYPISKNGITERDNIYMSSMLFTDRECSFLFFIDEFRENFYIYGKLEFILDLLPISIEDYAKYFENMIDKCYDLSYKNYLLRLKENCILRK